MIKVSSITHPDYDLHSWDKWRIIFAGGEEFIYTYCKKFSHREDDKDYRDRLLMTPCPAFAKAAIINIRNSVYSRLGDVTRYEGTDSYQKAVLGDERGVDLLGSSMNTFMGIKVLDELLTIGHVGIYVDMPIITGNTLADRGNKRPYIYLYPAEDIRSWGWDLGNNPNEFSSLLLRDHIDQIDKDTKLVTGKTTRYRLYAINEDRKVTVRYYDEDDKQIDINGEPTDETIVLDIDKIPFVFLHIGQSLLIDAANHQIALLNMGSADVAYSIKSNFPFYIEPFDPKSQSPYIKQQAAEFVQTSQDPFTQIESVSVDTNQEIRVGATTGRRYAQGLNPPAFIHPSPEPLKISIEKQDQLKTEIKELVNLALTNIANESAEAKSINNQGLESGLAYLGYVLQLAENRIGTLWSMYEGSASTPKITYPDEYKLLSISDQTKEIDQLTKLGTSIESTTYRRTIAKQLVKKSVGSFTSKEQIDRMFSEIDDAHIVIIDPALLITDLENGLVSHETASLARGYPVGETDKAKEDHAERLALIQAAQTKPGIADMDIEPGKSTRLEKEASRQTDTDVIPTDKTRGEGK